MAKLTGLSDSVLTRSGHMEVYEETFESLTFKLKKGPCSKDVYFNVNPLPRPPPVYWASQQLVGRAFVCLL